ncbi:MAG: hypothetical protein JRI23_09260 [Deltaproteobacteria bacterium]|nr:hypothetical protein [Deltaproteobacteria bacterium]MBW2531827.1 hypothetical protein [Deltaproteobacteria bacterium]
MFDLGFGEIALLAIVLLVVVGPRELPRLLRTIGRGITRLRTLSWELRAQSGIDEIIRDEDLQKDIEAVRSLSKGRIVDAIVNEAMRPPPDPYRPSPDAPDPEPDAEHWQPDEASESAESDDPEAPTDGDSAPDEAADEPPVEIDRPARDREAGQAKRRAQRDEDPT